MAFVSFHHQITLIFYGITFSIGNCRLFECYQINVIRFGREEKRESNFGYDWLNILTVNEIALDFNGAQSNGCESMRMWAKVEHRIVY